ncbi:MAG: outer membrane lipid asymmetry maintenance protein MlaD [Deltaproteobacteria bacterium]|nr:MAG: outer membrane lipid asymmetry maintenance protein MlaD [Deltaproteobacteria bacterium]
MTRAPLRDLLVGLFVLAGLGAIAYLSLSVGGLSARGPGGLTVFADFDEIGGLKPRAQVVISGVKVGQVASIALDDNYRARVKMDLDARLKLPIDTSASIVTSGLLGDRYVSLQLGGEPETLKPGDRIAMTESAVVLERLIGKLVYGGDRGKTE